MKLGLHYLIKYGMNEPPQHPVVGCECNLWEQTATGFNITRRTNFIAQYRTTLVLNADGTGRATTRATKNYFAPWSYTEYFDQNGYQITLGSVHKERAAYDKIRKELRNGNGSCKN